MASAAKYQEEWREREFEGYGLHTPNPQWPNKAKVCVSFVVQFNQGAENNVMNGDPFCATDFVEIPTFPQVPRRAEGNEQMFEYGGREGVLRLLNLFKSQGVPVTWNIYTQALQAGQYWAKALLESGAELSLAGHKYRDNFYVDPAEEDALISKSIDIFSEVTGQPPKGWFAERRSNLSVKLYSLAHQERQIPLAYSSDSCSDDLPYWVPSFANRSQGLLMIPYSYDCSDLRFNMKGSGWASPKDYYLHLKDTFDCLVEEADEGEPKMMTVLLHPYIVGHPNRVYWLKEFIKYITSTSDAWVARRIDIADHWSKKFPYDAKTAFGTGPTPAPCGQIKIPSQ